jgi:hypothetical protein
MASCDLQFKTRAPAETGEDFPFNVFEGLKTACERRESIYLDRFYEFAPAKNSGALRCVTLLPVAHRGEIDPDWVTSAHAYTDIVWIERGLGERPQLEPVDRAGEWVLRRGGRRSDTAATE